MTTHRKSPRHHLRHETEHLIMLTVIWTLIISNVVFATAALSYADLRTFGWAFIGTCGSLYARALTIDEMEETRDMNASTGYRAIARQLRWEIDEQVLPPGARINGYRQLAKRFGCTQTTISRAIRVLAQDGRVETRAGKGIYVVGGNGDKGTRVDTAFARVEAHLRRQIINGIPLADAEILKQVYNTSDSTIGRVHRKLLADGTIRRTGPGRYAATSR